MSYGLVMLVLEIPFIFVRYSFPHPLLNLGVATWFIFSQWKVIWISSWRISFSLIKLVKGTCSLFSFLGYCHVKVWCLDCGSPLATVGEKPLGWKPIHKGGGTKEWGNVYDLKYRAYSPFLQDCRKLLGSLSVSRELRKTQKSKYQNLSALGVVSYSILWTKM